MKQRLLFYTVWIAIFLCISILILFITAITQGYFPYLNLLIYVPMIILSSVSFAVIFEDKWWVSLIEGMVTSLPGSLPILFYLNTFNCRKVKEYSFYFSLSPSTSPIFRVELSANTSLTMFVSCSFNSLIN